MGHFHLVHVWFTRLSFSILYKSYFRRLVIMVQYHLRSLPSHHYAAMHAGDELDENKEFYGSFDFLQETALPGTSTGNSSGQFSCPLAQNRGPIGSQDDITELTAAIAQAKAENDE